MDSESAPIDALRRYVAVANFMRILRSLTLHKMWETKSYSDLTILTANTEIQAHKAMLVRPEGRDIPNAHIPPASCSIQTYSRMPRMTISWTFGMRMQGQSSS